MKKRLVTATLVCTMALAMAACGKPAADDSQQANGGSASQSSVASQDNSASQNNNTSQDAEEVNPVCLVFHPATMGSYATIKIDSSIKMDDTSAWLGLCPAGKDYITELEADEVDVIWFGMEGREEDSDPYVFACDFESVEDGKYALVVATSDDENVGYVVIQLAMEKKDDKLTFDYTNAQIKERP